MKRSEIFSLFVTFSIVFIGSCTDTNIEGAASITSGFKIKQTTYTSGTVNGGSCASSGKFGTNFTITISYEGTEKITLIKETYKFITGTTSGTPTTVTLNSSSDYTDKNSSTPGAFRAGSSSAVTRGPICVNFGTTTAIQLDYAITTNATPSKTYNTVTLVINKPTGAN